MKITKGSAKPHKAHHAGPPHGGAAEAGRMPWLNEVPRGGGDPVAARELQRRLKAAGFDPGPADGWFGPRTAAALRRFQEAKGLKPDSQAGPQTWGALGLQGAPRTKAPGPAAPAPSPHVKSGMDLPSAPKPADTPPDSPAPALPPTGPAAKPAVTFMPTPSQGSRNGVAIDTIVLHHTASGGTAEDVGRYVQTPAAKVSSHYIVGKDGQIVQSVNDEDRAWHAGKSEYEGRSNVNDFSLGIEIVNWGDGQDPYPPAQYKALAELVLYLQTKHSVPWERIIGHKDVALPRGRKIDPSPNFSYETLRAEVAKLQAAEA